MASNLDVEIEFRESNFLQNRLESNRIEYIPDLHTEGLHLALWDGGRVAVGMELVKVEFALPHKG